MESDLALSGLVSREVARDLDFAPERLRTTFDAADEADPVYVRQSRDHLEQAARDAGRSPVVHTVLTERSRAPARVPLSPRGDPRHVFPTV
ncbi:DUF2316 family protein [Streptomyces tsukubensis]|uniref:DUF2316 family protein n=1 Tax=Streptomyces tsukubensis TaxID=83656 RepID=UPI000D1CFA58